MSQRVILMLKASGLMRLIANLSYSKLLVPLCKFSESTVEQCYFIIRVMMGVLTAMIAWLLTDYDALCYVQTETWVFWVFLFAAPIVCGLTFCV